MKIFESMDKWITYRDEVLSHRSVLGFVPTMGALHEGHLSLIERSKIENDITVVSIFVNPTQFNNSEDLEKYPRPIDQDLELLRKAEVEVVLLPTKNEIYANGYNFQMHELSISQLLCGAHRPGHFTGVLTIVLKLLGITRANRCYMGEKDYQQYLLVHEMAKEFFLSTQIVPCPTVREASGLALSSRNMRLSLQAKSTATEIYHYLKNLKSTDEVRSALNSTGFDVEYVEDHWGRRFVAAWIEGVRLIDNVKI
jgi:pantoate--beta-alanine ligase